MYEDIEQGMLSFNKICQIRWLKDEVRDSCKEVWSLGRIISMDKMMIRYKNNICTHMPIYA